MKQKLLIILFATFIAACGQEPAITPNAVQEPAASSRLTHIRIMGRPGEQLEYVDRLNALHKQVRIRITPKCG